MDNNEEINSENGCGRLKLDQLKTLPGYDLVKALFKEMDCECCREIKWEDNTDENTDEYL